jgi:uncharacterized protein (TIGR02594 family)
MTAANYDASLARLLVHEGGYSNHPSDPGGPTNYGITIHDFRKYIDRNGTAADVRAMTVEQAKTIYRRRYWDVQRCDQLPAGVDYAIFDYGVNSGIGRSGKVLRRVLGLSDGTSAITDEVIAAAGRRDPKVLASAICDERLAFLRGLGTWPTFGRGWGRRVAEVRAAALAMAGASQGVITPSAPPSPPSGEGPARIPQMPPAPAQAGASPSPPSARSRASSPSDSEGPARTPQISAPPSPLGEGPAWTPQMPPPWLARMNAILGLYEFQGGADNPAILAMAKACGGSIAREYRHDSIPWCALTINYVLIASGLPGNDSLWALDFAKYGKRLSGPAVGCIASQKRSGGGHVYLVVGRTSDGKIVGRGGNQSDMVCDTTFLASDGTRTYTWPVAHPVPTNQTFASLPIVRPAPKAHKDIVLPPPTRLELPGKGAVPEPKVTKPIATGAGGASAAAGVTWWDWVQTHPLETALIAAGVALMVAAAVHAVRRHDKAKQEAPTPGLVPVFAAPEASTGEPGDAR